MKNIRFYTIAVLFDRQLTSKVNRCLHMDIRYSTFDIGSHVISCLREYQSLTTNKIYSFNPPGIFGHTLLWVGFSNIEMTISAAKHFPSGNGLSSKVSHFGEASDSKTNISYIIQNILLNIILKCLFVSFRVSFRLLDVRITISTAKLLFITKLYQMNVILSIAYLIVKSEYFNIMRVWLCEEFPITQIWRIQLITGLVEFFLAEHRNNPIAKYFSLALYSSPIIRQFSH